MSKKILVVDDEKHIVKIITFNLKRRGYKTIEACNGLDALDKFNNDDIDLIILDVMMPKMTGFELCQKLRLDEVKIPIIMLTAKGQEFDIDKGLKYGADDYLTKPFSPRKLMEILDG